MEQLNRMNRPAPAGGPLPNQAPVPAGVNAPKPKNKKDGMGKIAKIVAVAVVTVIVLVAIFGFIYKATQGIGSEINQDKYQAVFLNSADGQVYFGKMSVLNNDYYRLTDIYYVRVENVQPNPNETPQQNISLAKLGNEIHGPEDTMYIRKEHVMFWENLKDDGQVVTAITEYKKNGGTNGQPNTNQQTNTDQQNDSNTADDQNTNN